MSATLPSVFAPLVDTADDIESATDNDAADPPAAPWAASSYACTDQLLAGLMQATAGGCSESFARLYQLTSTRLFSVTLRIVRHHGEAEEVLQEVYLKVWQRCGQFDAGKGHAVHWMLGIAHNSALDKLRRRQTRPQEWISAPADGVASGSCSVYAESVCGQAQPPERLMALQATAAVLDGLRGLSAQQREMLTLAYVDGLSHTQIATFLQRPLGSVKSVLRRALLQMRPALADHA